MMNFCQVISEIM